MSATKNGVRRLPVRPLTPQSSAGEEFTATAPAESKQTQLETDLKFLRYKFDSEKKSLVHLQHILMKANGAQEKHILDLQAQVADLRSAAISNLAAGMRVSQ